MQINGERVTVSKLADWMLCAHYKDKARRLYLAIAREQRRISCGADLQDVISPRIGEKIAELHATLTKLATIDPDCRALIEREGLPFSGRTPQSQT